MKGFRMPAIPSDAICIRVAVQLSNDMSNPLEITSRNLFSMCTVHDILGQGAPCATKKHVTATVSLQTKKKFPKCF
jgi:hypothetical protein